MFLAPDGPDAEPQGLTMNILAIAAAHYLRHAERLAEGYRYDTGLFDTPEHRAFHSVLGELDTRLRVGEPVHHVVNGVLYAPLDYGAE